MQRNPPHQVHSFFNGHFQDRAVNWLRLTFPDNACCKMAAIFHHPIILQFKILRQQFLHDMRLLHPRQPRIQTVHRVRKTLVVEAELIQ